MGKKNRKRFAPDQNGDLTKRARIGEADDVISAKQANESLSVRVEKTDIIERKVELLVKDETNRTNRSLTICGAGLGIEKTIAVVEEMKRHYLKNGSTYSQETFLKAGPNNEPQIQVILTLLNSNTSNQQ